ncbi:hypothetical protein [Streptomyces sp. NPDC060243]|uniref:hypothetical protein n=1 Tax=Streptomyces sp. NPDC060243 TaxID=3347081 RepID=UPI00365A34F3
MPTQTRTPAPAVLDEQLAATLDTLRGIHPGLDQVAEGLEHLARIPHTPTSTADTVATLAGAEGADVVTAIGYLIATLTAPDTNPALHTLPAHAQKTAQQLGERAAFDLTDPILRIHATEAAALIDQQH